MTKKGMTAEQLEELVLAADREALFERLAPLTEAQRKSLSEALISIAVPLNRHWGPGGSKNDCEDEYGRALLAKAEKHSDMRDRPEELLRVLVDRKPKWINGWLEFEIKQEIPALRTLIERGLMRSSVIPTNTTRSITTGLT